MAQQIRGSLEEFFVLLIVFGDPLAPECAFGHQDDGPAVEETVEVGVDLLRRCRRRLRPEEEQVSTVR